MLEPEEDRTEIFLKLLAEHERTIRVYVIAMVGKVHDAEEILQDTRLAMWKHFDQFKVGSNFKAWGRKIAYHRILAFRTQRSREARRAELSEKFYEQLDASIEEVMANKHAQTQLQHCMQKLREEHRKIIHLRYSEEKSVEEVAEMMQKTIAATYRVISRIRESLRRCVKNTQPAA